MSADVTHRIRYWRKPTLSSVIVGIAAVNIGGAYLQMHGAPDHVGWFAGALLAFLTNQVFGRKQHYVLIKKEVDL